MEIRHRKSGRLLCRSVGGDGGRRLTDADLVGAALAGADLRGTDLHASDLRGSDLRGVDLRDADLRGVRLAGAGLALPASTCVFTSLSNLLLFILLTGRWYPWWLNYNLLLAAIFALFALYLLLGDRSPFVDADLTGAKLENARYDDRTKWPPGFDPRSAGAVYASRQDGRASGQRI
jgi:uncharacterized protein YjbI with pentapeptide repeats